MRSVRGARMDKDAAAGLVDAREMLGRRAALLLAVLRAVAALLVVTVLSTVTMMLRMMLRVMGITCGNVARVVRGRRQQTSVVGRRREQTSVVRGRRAGRRRNL